MLKKKLSFVTSFICSIVITTSVFASAAIPVPGDGVNEGFTKLTKEQTAQEQIKSKAAQEYANSKLKSESTQKAGSISPLAVIIDGNNKYNSVGTFRQSLGYTCGPASARNLVNKYAPGHGYILSWGTSSNWNANLSAKVMSTIDKANCYNVIGDLYHGATTTPISPVYANGAAHYICIHGYNNVDKKYFVSDSNSAALVQYKAPYLNMANSTQKRGVIW
jgi:hypothetical protein